MNATTIATAPIPGSPAANIDSVHARRHAVTPSMAFEGQRLGQECPSGQGCIRYAVDLSVPNVTVSPKVSPTEPVGGGNR